MQVALVTLRYYRSISVECTACGKSKSQNTGFSFYQLSSVQSGGKSKSQNTGFPFYQFIKQVKHIHGNRYTLNSNTFTTRSENSYKRTFWRAYSEQCS